MTATNMCSNFGGKWDSPPLLKMDFECLFVCLFCAADLLPWRRIQSMLGVFLEKVLAVTTI